MINLTENQKLRITRIGRSLTLEDTSKKLFLSPSFVSLMEHGKRKIPDDVKNILDFENGIKWYQDLVASLKYASITEAPLSEKDAKEALDILNKVLRINF